MTRRELIGAAIAAAFAPLLAKFPKATEPEPFTLETWRDAAGLDPRGYSRLGDIHLYDRPLLIRDRAGKVHQVFMNMTAEEHREAQDKCDAREWVYRPAAWSA